MPSKPGLSAPGSAKIVGSTINTVVGGAGYIVGNLIGKNIEVGGDKLLDVGKKMLDGGVLSKIGGGAVIFFGGVTKAIGWLLSTISNICSALTEKLTSLLTSGGEKHNTRVSVRNAILHHVENDGTAAYAMENSSLGTKKELLELLLNKGQNTAKDQKAAVEVLLAAREAEQLEELTKEMGGTDKLISLFTDPAAGEVKTILNGEQKRGARASKVTD